MDNFYWGWGVRDNIGASIKRPINRLGRSIEERSVSRLAEQISERLHTQKLDSEAGRKQLASQMSTRILETSLNEDQPETDEVLGLAFHSHVAKFCHAILEYEQLFELPVALIGKETSNQSLLGKLLSKPTVTRSELWEIEDQLKRTERILDNFDQSIGELALLVLHVVTPLIEACPSLLETRHQNAASHTTGKVTSETLSLSAPISMLINNSGDYVERLLQLPFAPEFDEVATTTHLRDRLEYNLNIVSGGAPGDEKQNPAKAKLPTVLEKLYSTDELIKHYLEGTPYLRLLDYSVPISIPQETRFEHQHIVAGSGHGKTQTLQHFLLHDLEQAAKGNASVVVLDSQGDLIQNIRSVEMFAPGNPLAEKLIVIDPTDVEYPVSLNLFDVNMERINQYSQLDRERMTNGILELYDFVLGSLLGAEMTQKQSVIFRYITRLLLHIPNATIHTLRELLEEGGADKYREHINTLQGTAKAFFQTEFDSREFTQTKRQVVRRLWGILENQTFERMFSHPRNKLDLYSEMNAGKVILINTAKDLLKENGTQIFGRFFIAMIAQAAQERSVIDKDKRMPTYVYVDEAQDYFDHNIEIILSQARKYKIGMILAHQYLGQLDNKLQDGVFANTAIKMAGGVSAKDARTLANEMRSPATFIEEQDKLSFATHIKGTTNQAVSLKITPGQMERLPRMNKLDFERQKLTMRERYAQHYMAAGVGSENIHTQPIVGDADIENQQPMKWD